MRSPAISIIIPAYNVEKWLSRAVESILNQTFTDYELFLVDDGSTDNTPEICDELAKKDPRIKVIHQKNAGAAGARNTAIKEASGEYLYFMDGDDWCEPQMLEDMYSYAMLGDLDLVITGFYIDTYYSDTKAFTELRNAPDKIYESQHDFRANSHDLFDAQLLYAPWNKLYRRTYLTDNKILFPDTFWDDLPFNLMVLRNVNRVGCIDGHYYHFLRAREEAENTKYRPNMYDKREEENEWMHELYDYWGLNSTEIQEFLARRYAERLLGCIENITCKDCDLSNKEKKEIVREMLNKDHAKEALELNNPRTLMMRVVMAPLKSGNVSLTLMQSKFISWVKRNNTNMFARLKANR